jgi:uncharacterized protein YjbI with pentapeptide repeats
MKIEIKNIFSSVIFTHECDSNTIALTIMEAVARGVNLGGVNLGGANLHCADLRGAVGNSREIKSLSILNWPIAFTDTEMAIGCKQFAIGEWKNFTDEEIDNMEHTALAWWKKHKDFIFLSIELSREWS